MTLRSVAPLLFLAFALTGCGDPATAPDASGADRQQTSPSVPAETADPGAPADEGQLYEATGMVLETQADGPQLCLGVVLESLPPQCDGLPLERWDWAKVEGEETSGGTTWGDFHVTGTYDGTTFAVSDVGPPKALDESDGDSIGTPCPEPSGGWAPVDPARSSQEHASEAAQAARKLPDFAGVWVDYYGEGDPDATSDEEAYGDIILNVAFTDDPQRHEAELRELWGGPLCLTENDRSYRDIRAIQRELTDIAEREFDLRLLWSDVDETRGIVEIGVIVIDDETRAELDERYGGGVVKVDTALRPVEP